MSSAVNPANPENSQAISDAGDAQASLQAARDDINAQANALTADASWMDGAWDYVQSSLSDLEDTLRLWGVTTSGIDPDKLTIDPMTGQPTSSSTDNRTSATIALLPALKALAQISQIRKRMTVQIAAMNHAAAALLDAVDCADSYLVAAGVDVNAQRGQSVSVQNTWSARTPQVDDSPNSNAALDPDYDPTGGDSGNFVPQLWTHDGEPDPTQVNPGDVWIDTSIDLGPIPMVPPP
jgi:hypothetical protein